jgi:predicted dehydrogenase
MPPLKLGIVGAGFMAQFHAKAIQQVRDFDIAGITSRHRAADLADVVRENNLGEGKIYPNLTEMAKNVDVVVLCAPNYAKLELMEELAAAVRAGANLKGVICEKPLGRNVKEARRMVDLAQSAGLKTAYFENQIFMKTLQTQRIQLAPQQRALGPLSLVRSSEEHGGPHEAWFWDPIRQGGGALNDMGCHCIAAAWYALTPLGNPPTFLRPISISADTSLLKWGRPEWREILRSEHGIDYKKTPAEDFASGIITFRNPETSQLSKAQFTSSWMFEKQGMRLFMEGMGPGYAFEINTLSSSVNIFIGDDAADVVGNVEMGLEKSTASRGLLALQHNEADLYGYTDELVDAARAFRLGRDALLPWSYGLEITRLVMAAYMSAEKRKTIDLTDWATQMELENYIPLIQQGRGAEILY